MASSTGSAFPKEGARVWRHSYRINVGENTADKFRGVILNDNDFFLYIHPWDSRFLWRISKCILKRAASASCGLKDASEGSLPMAAQFRESANIWRLFHVSFLLPFPLHAFDWPTVPDAVFLLPPEFLNLCCLFLLQWFLRSYLVEYRDVGTQDQVQTESAIGRSKGKMCVWGETWTEIRVAGVGQKNTGSQEVPILSWTLPPWQDTITYSSFGFFICNIQALN